MINCVVHWIWCTWNCRVWSHLILERSSFTFVLLCTWCVKWLRWIVSGSSIICVAPRFTWCLLKCEWWMVRLLTIVSANCFALCLLSFLARLLVVPSCSWRLLPRVTLQVTDVLFIDHCVFEIVAVGRFWLFYVSSLWLQVLPEACSLLNDRCYVFCG